MAHQVKVLDTSMTTHDVKRFVLSKPNGYEFCAGQATDFSLPEGKFSDEKRPFSFTPLNARDDLEFHIKIYEEHDGMTEALMDVGVDDELVIHDPFGAIAYEKPGLFIAGGAGITPFIAIFRLLKEDGKLKDNALFFANKTEKDIILHQEIVSMFGDDVRFTLSQEEKPNFDHGRIGLPYIRNHVVDLNQHFYVCGPPPMVEGVTNSLITLGADENCVITEEAG